MNSWCAIAPLHKDATKVKIDFNKFLFMSCFKIILYILIKTYLKEPFIDISIGGNQMPGGNPGGLIVWAVTAYGRVPLYFYSK